MGKRGIYRMQSICERGARSWVMPDMAGRPGLTSKYWSWSAYRRSKHPSGVGVSMTLLALLPSNLMLCIPWIIDDLYALRRASGRKLEELPCLSENMEPYWILAREYPLEWKTIVKQLCDFNVEVVAGSPVEPYTDHLDGLSLFTCNQCNK